MQEKEKSRKEIKERKQWSDESINKYIIPENPCKFFHSYHHCTSHEHYQLPFHDNEQNSSMKKKNIFFPNVAKNMFLHNSIFLICV